MTNINLFEAASRHSQAQNNQQQNTVKESQAFMNVLAQKVDKQAAFVSALKASEETYLRQQKDDIEIGDHMDIYATEEETMEQTYKKLKNKLKGLIQLEQKILGL